MKKYLLTLLSFLIAPAMAFAALDATLENATELTVNGINLVVSGDAVMDSITVDDSTFSVTLSPGSSITVTSSDRKAMTASPNTFTTAYSCAQNQSAITLAIPSSSSNSATAVTITPSTSTCDVPGGGSPSGSSGGSGGGGGSGVPTPVYTVIPGTASSAASVSSAASSQTGAVVTRTTTGQTITQTVATPSGITITITKTLKQGSENSEVRSLQEALAQDPEIYPEGKVTGYFGPATRRAIVRFQEKHGIEPVGFVGPQTRAKLMEVYNSSAQILTKTVSTPSGTTVTLTKTLKLGNENSEVISLQEMLAQDPEVYPEGKITGYFGALTRKAVIRFQQKYGLEPVGHVGPLTRAKLMELYGNTSNPASSQSSSSESIQTTTSTSDQQIQQLMEQINALQKQIKGLQ